MIAKVPTKWHAVCDLCRGRLDSIVWSGRLVKRMTVAVHGYGPHLCRGCRHGD